MADGSTGGALVSVAVIDSVVSAPKSSAAACAGGGGGAAAAGGGGAAARAGAGDCASASAITLSTKAVTSGAFFGPPANQVVLQRAQRTVRPAGPTEAGSIM